MSAFSKIAESRRGLAAFMAIVIALMVPAASAELTAEDQRQLAAGDAIIRVTPADSPADGDVAAVIDIPVPRTRVWQVLVDCERAPAVMPNLTGCAVLQTGPGNAWDVREHRVHWMSVLPDIRTQFRSDYVRETSIMFKRTSGDMLALEGSWRLEPLNAGSATRLRYDARVGFGALIPSFIIRNALAADVPEFLKAIRAEAVRLAGLQTQTR